MRRPGRGQRSWSGTSATCPASPRSTPDPAWPAPALRAALRGVYTQCILRRYECAPHPPGPARARAEPRLRPQARLRHLLRAGQAAAVRAGLRDARPAGPGRQGRWPARPSRARGRTASATSSPRPGGRRSTRGSPSRPSRSRTCRRSVRQGGAGPDARPPGRAVPGHAAGGSPAADAGADRAQAQRAAWSTRCSPTTACSTWRRTCGGSTSRRPGWARWPRRCAMSTA